MRTDTTRKKIRNNVGPGIESWGGGTCINAKKDLEEWPFRQLSFRELIRKTESVQKFVQKYHNLSTCEEDQCVKCLRDIQSNSPSFTNLILSLINFFSNNHKHLRVDRDKQKPYYLSERKLCKVRCITNSDLIRSIRLNL